MDALFDLYANFAAHATTGVNTTEVMSWNEFFTYMSAYRYYYNLAPSVFRDCAILLAVGVVAICVIVISDKHKKVNA